MKKRTLALMLSAALCVGMLAGCGGGTQGSAETPDTTSPSAETPAGEEPAEVSGTVNTDGSTSMADVMAAFQETFGDLYPDVTVNYSGTGSGSGITNALAGTVDIGLSSRALTDDEKAEGAVENIVALDGVAIVVNPENTVTSLTVEQIAQIYKGEVTNWSELGGADAPIAVIGRDAASGTRGSFEEIVGFEVDC